MTPTVGRIVHYTPPESGAHRAKEQPYPAIITHVFGEDCVNLQVCNDGSFPLGVEPHPTSVMRGTGPRTWAWPPSVPAQNAPTDPRLEAHGLRIGAITDNVGAIVERMNDLAGRLEAIELAQQQPAGPAQVPQTTEG